MNILITGAEGLLGRRLATALSGRGHQVIGVGHAALDITDFSQAQQVITAAAPTLVLHCAAMIQVDRCAEQPDKALHINGFGTRNIALICQQMGIALAYISTNEVFDGEQVSGYLEYDPPRPINPYGYSKWFGEQAVCDLVARHYIIRTSWVFAHGGDNFLHRILNAAARGDQLSVVINEVAAPTYMDDLADAVSRLVESERYGVYHLVNEGRASRYQFARHLLDCADYADRPITPILSMQRYRPSTPPVYGVLRNFAAAQSGIILRPWQAAVEAFFAQERASNAAAARIPAAPPLAMVKP